MKIAFWDWSGINLMIKLFLMYQKFVPVVLTTKSLIQLKPSIFDPLGLVNPVKVKRLKIFSRCLLWEIYLGYFNSMLFIHIL